MHTIDFIVFGLYLLVVLGVGLFFFFKNRGVTDYFVCDRNMGAGHVGLSVVATDVGGGFSIGLGGLGYTMGLSGHWMLFTGLVGAWMSAVLVIPLIKRSDIERQHLTYPQFLNTRYSSSVALVAAIISMIGYWGFTGGQIRAGVTLAEGTVLRDIDIGMSREAFCFLVIGTVTVLYTVLGGLSAVVYTDMIQYGILLVGLVLITVPMALWNTEIGGIEGLRQALPEDHMDFFKPGLARAINWAVAITPIWLIAMTLYQRIYACRDVKTARRAWFFAGLLEWPVMAFMGVFLGMCGRVLFPDLANAEEAVPRVIMHVLPPMGLTGLVVAAYFSAIMSTADSCMVAAAGNFTGDIVRDRINPKMSGKSLMRVALVATLVIGVTSLWLAWKMENVLDIILLSYGFMVAGLFIPTLGAMFWKRSSSAGALAGMLVGGSVTVAMNLLFQMEFAKTPEGQEPANWLALVQSWGLSPTVYGVFICAVFFVAFSLLLPDKGGETPVERAEKNG